jgi:hypothetical protein
MPQPAVSRASGAAPAWSYRLAAGLLWALLVSCRGSQAEPNRNSAGKSSAGAAHTPNVSDVASGSAGVGQGVAQLAAEPEQFRFVVPLAYLPHELRGEGSERVLAPRDAQVSAGAREIRVEAGNDFALQIQFQPALTSLPASAAGAQRVAAESDLAVFKSEDGYWFVALRELVPEWDESERRRVACGSAGALGPEGSGAPRRFTHAAVERMVAACRSLELPSLE